MSESRPPQNVPQHGPYRVRSSTAVLADRPGRPGATAVTWTVEDARGRFAASMGKLSDAAAYLRELEQGGQAVDVPLADGTTATIAARDRDRFAGLSAEGYRLYRDDLLDGGLFPSTPCCNTSGKGSGSATGVVCRACHTTVDSVFGWILPLAVAVA